MLRAMIKLTLLLTVVMALTGCKEYARWQETQARADVQHEHAEILKLYRQCLTEHKGHPKDAKENCEHYTQALTVLDVRGLK